MGDSPISFSKLLAGRKLGSPSQPIPPDSTVPSELTLSFSERVSTDDTLLLNETAAVNETPTRSGPVSQPVLQPLRAERVSPGEGVGFTEIPHSIVDELFATLDPYEQALFLQLWRLTAGWHRDTCWASIPKLCARANIGRTKATLALKALENRGLIERLAVNIDSPNLSERGINWRVPLAAARVKPHRRAKPSRVTTPSSNETMKENHERNHERALVAVAPAPDVYKIREKALRIREAGGAGSGIDLRAAVRSWLIGEGHEIDEAVIEEALRGMA